MLYLAGKGSIEECKDMAKQQIKNGNAFKKLKEMVKAQGGDVSVLEDYSKFDQPAVEYKIIAPSSGYIYSMNTEQCGIASVALGAGREKKEDSIDFSAGIILTKKVGDTVLKGETIAKFYSSSLDKCKTAEKIFLNAITISDEKPNDIPIVHARITIDGVQKF